VRSYRATGIIGRGLGYVLATVEAARLSMCKIRCNFHLVLLRGLRVFAYRVGR
jgi:hypothetical protein